MTLHRDLRLVLVKPQEHLLLRSTALESQNGFRRLARQSAVLSTLDSKGEIQHRHARQTADLEVMSSEWTPNGTTGMLTSKGTEVKWSFPFEAETSWKPLTPKSGPFLRLKHSALGANVTLPDSAQIQWSDQTFKWPNTSGSALWIDGAAAPKRAIQICVSHSEFSCVAHLLPRPRLLGYTARLGTQLGFTRNLWENLSSRVSLDRDLWRSEMRVGDLSVRVELHATKKHGFQIMGENADGAPHVVSVFPFCETEVHVYQGTKLQTTHRIGRVGTYFQTSEDPDPYATPLN